MGLCFRRRRSRVCGSSAVRVRVGDASYLGSSSDWADNMKLLFADERASSPDVKAPRRQGLNENGSDVSWSLRYWGCTLQLEEGVRPRSTCGYVLSCLCWNLGSVLAQPGLRGRSLSGLVSVSQRKVLVQATV
ncbi:hypothetical protein F2Q69_00008460 [Brassica cretica]|uniref:Uncharacterized protein n=1 Tax=Brassica cretica TaxID=69181 RepID=A0A8S9PHW1_BRACR|nr:hypothetical protein F2Q69_00008460 [Brassica cretica]